MFENLLGAAIGGLFGFALDKAKTSVPWVITNQMRLDMFVMMRMFLAASATSVGVVLLLDKLGVKPRCSKPGIALGFGKLGGFGGNIVGGALLGMGMSLTGSCPGTIWAQIGAGMPYVSGVILGGLTGTIFFGYLERILRASQPNFHKAREHDPTPTGTSYLIGSILFIGIMAGAIATFQHFFPWQEDLKLVVSNYESPSWFLDPTAIVWDPVTAGVLLGLLQIPAQLSSGKALGQSSGWVVLASYIAEIFDPHMKEHAPYLKKHQTDAKARFQVVTALGIIGGAALSKYLSGYELTATADAGCGSYANAFFGGFLLLVGSRLGGGCTSGHGLSGMATLSLGSTLSVVGMFAGGIAVAFLMNP